MKAAWCVFVAVLAVLCVSDARRIPWWNIKIAQEQGPNACVVEEMPGTNWQLWTECKYWLDRKICGQKTMIRYECCEGYQQVPGQQGCTGVKPLKNLLETARDLGARKFVEYIEESGLASELTKEGAFTLFAPLDEAFENLPRSQRTRLEAYQRSPQNPILLYHLADGKITTHHLRSDVQVDSRYPGYQLRINKYSNGLETVNCALIVRKDLEATNGIVHIVGSLLDPFKTVQNELAEMVVQDGRFSELAKAMTQSGFINRLRAADHSFTVLAPSDEAFQKIPASRMEKILSDDTARDALLENHVIPHSLCLPAVIGEHKVRTLGPEKLTFNCDRSGKTVEEKRLRADFTLGKNGMLYMIDDVLLPNRAKSIVQLLEQEKLFAFLMLIRVGGVEDFFESFGDYTLFVPSEAAMYSMSSEQLEELKSSREKARKFVLYHAVQGRIKSNKISDNQILMSLDEENSLRLLVYRKAIGVENAIIEKSDVEGMNGCVHVINKALFPSNASAGDILRKNGNFSIFLQAMEKVMSSSPGTLELQKAGSSYTFFVPTDQAFTRLGSTRLERMMNDVPYLTKTIKNHVVENMMASEAFKPGLYYDVQTRQNPVDIVRKNGKLKVKCRSRKNSTAWVNDATVINSDILNTNGVIHVINRVLLPDQNLRG